MREIVLDTETTGLDPLRGDRLVEIGCVEMLNRIPTGQSFHVYINPERDMPVEAFNVHGLSTEFLSDKPVFAAVADEFLSFIADSPLVIHNASFDIGFLNAELTRLGRVVLGFERVVDTLALARRRHPGGPNRLDDLCARYGIDLSRRTKHGALLDSELLAEVYAELAGGRQAALGLVSAEVSAARRTVGASVRQRPVPLAPRISVMEAAAHAAFVATLGEAPLWNEYAGAVTENPEAGAS